MVKIFESLMTLKNPTSVEMFLTPKIKIYLDKRLLDQNKEKILSFCNKIPMEDLSGKNLICRHVDQDEFYALFLLAIGDKLGAWERFPSHRVDWNVPNWPYAIRKPVSGSATS